MDRVIDTGVGAAHSLGTIQTREQSSSRTDRILLAIVAVGLLCRALAALRFLAHPSLAKQPDDYMHIARVLGAVGHYPQAACFPPGYPIFCLFFLWLAHYSPTFSVIGVILSQIVLSAACVLLTYKIALLMGLDIRWASLAALLVAVDPILIDEVPYIGSETLYTFLLELSVLILFVGLRRRASTNTALYLLCSGLLLGAATLSRAMGMGVAVVWLILCFALARTHRRRVYNVAFVLSPLIVVLLIWSWNNWRLYGKFEPTVSGSYNFAALVVGPAKDWAEGKEMGANLYPWEDRLPQVRRARTDPSYVWLISNKVAMVALKWALAHPKALAKGLARGQASILAAPGKDRWGVILANGHPGFGARLFIILLTAYRVALDLLALVAVWRLNRAEFRGVRVFGIGLLLIVALHALSSGSDGDSRFICPSSPYLDLLAAMGVAGLLHTSALAWERNKDSAFAAGIMDKAA